MEWSIEASYTHSMDYTFENFLKDIDLQANQDGFEGSYTEQTGADCWQQAFDEGQTANEAWREERSEWTE